MQTVFLTILVIKSKSLTMAHQALQDLARLLLCYLPFLSALITKLYHGVCFLNPGARIPS